MHLQERKATLCISSLFQVALMMQSGIVGAVPAPYGVYNLDVPSEAVSYPHLSDGAPV